MPLTQVVAGNRILASDLNAFYNLLKGVAASGESVVLIYNATALTFQPSSDPAAGTRVLDIKNNAGTHLASIDYNGVLELLAAAAAPGGAVAGAVYFDTLLSALRVHDGTNWRDIAGGSSGPLPNLVLNSDFSRRTVFGLAMPEVFADLSGTTKIDGGAAGSVAANIFTQGAANNEYAWCAGSFVWRDGRASATFKATAIAGIYEQRWRISATDYISVKQNNGNFTITKFIASALTVTSTVANVLTINRWYWIELDKQGTTVNARIYDTGGTVPGVTKASSTLITAANLTATIADASVAVGASVSITSDQAAAQWGGIATGNGGVYVETWLPESWTVAHTGTLGGQAIGFDESADSGPNVTGAPYKQWAMRVYIPAASRTMAIAQPASTGNTAYGTISPAAAYTYSTYYKVSGKGGSGDLLTYFFVETTAAGADNVTANQLHDASSTSWARLTGTATTGAASRGLRMSLNINNGSTATGTIYFQLPQLEQGSAATAWRNAPEDASDLVWVLPLTLSTKDTTSAAFVEVEPRDLAGNLFIPRDCTVRADVVLGSQLTAFTANRNLQSDVNMDGTSFVSTATGGLGYDVHTAASLTRIAHYTAIARVSAGKHRFALLWKVSGDTARAFGNGSAADSRLVITASAGK